MLWEWKCKNNDQSLTKQQTWFEEVKDKKTQRKKNNVSEQQLLIKHCSHVLQILKKASKLKYLTAWIATNKKKIFKTWLKKSEYQY